MAHPGNGTANILLAEDSDDDAAILSRALKHADIDHVLIRVANGEEAITYLTEKPRPDLLLLDLKMPKVDGFDVLAFIRGHPELKDLPVVILSASDWTKDVNRVRHLGVTDYLVKDTDWKIVVTGLKLCLAQILPG